MANLINAYDSFLYYKQLSGLTEKSIICYRSFVATFINHVGNLALDSLNKEIVQSYLEQLFNRNLSKATIATYIRHVKIFLVWLEQNYSVNYDSEKIKVPKSPKKQAHIYNDNEIQIIFETIYDKNDWVSVRNCTIIAFMLDSGLRQNEVCTLEKKNVDTTNYIVKVYGKGDKERFVPMGKTTMAFLNEYYSKCSHDETYVFTTKVGEIITGNAVKLFMSKYSKEMPFDFSSHKLRHNFATNFLIDQYYKNGFMDIYALMSIMGHESIETTKRYLHTANQIVYSKHHISHIDKIFVK